MQSFDFISLLLGLAIGLIFFLLNYLNQNKKGEALRNLCSSQEARIKSADERHKEYDMQLLQNNLKLEQKQGELNSLISENASLLSHIQNAKEQLQKAVGELTEQKNENYARQNEINQLKQNLAESKTQNHFFLEKLENQKRDFEEMKNRAQLEFQELAQKILEEKSQKFTSANKENLDSLLKPLGENIDQFKKRVEETYDKESKQRFSLEERVKELVEMNHKLSKEANNLASALKGQSKKQGNWGEIILESILEKSGLQKNREYKVQVSMQTEDGKRLQPDVVVYLPDNRTIIIDSKVSLIAYDRFSSSETKEDQDAALKEHVKSMYQHIDQLGDKKYDTLVESLDFTMMFVPIEPAYLIAMQEDQELWAYAYAKRILLISPTNLITSLKLIADLWKREQQSKNALEIAKQGERMYDKIIGFLESMEDVGKHLNKSQDAYHKAVGQLRDGRGSLVSRAEKMKKLGLNSQKEIPGTLMSFDESEEEEETDKI